MTRAAGLLAAFCRLLLGGAFLYAGFSKLADPGAFQADILAYQLATSYPLTAFAAVYLPPLEILCGLLILIAPLPPVPDWLRQFDLPALAIVTFLMLLFTIAFLSTVLRGIEIGCGCFGEALREWPAWLIITRDLVLLSSSIFLLRRSSSKPS